MEAQEQGSRSLLHIQCLDYCLGTRNTLGSYLASLGEGGMNLEFAKKTFDLSTDDGIELEICLKDF